MVMEASSKFSFTHYKPVVSPCGHSIAFVNASRLIIRSTHTQATLRTVQLSEGFIKVTQISWEPPFKGISSKLAILLANEERIRVVDVQGTVDAFIEEDDVFGIERFEWLGLGDSPEETAYTGSKQLAVYTESGLMVKIYSLDYHSCIMELDKPICDLIQRGDRWSVVTLNERSLKLTTCFNEGSQSRILYKSDLTGVSNVERCLICPSGKWLLSSEESLEGTSLKVFTMMGDITGRIGPLLKHQSIADPLGPTNIVFIDDNTVIYGDHLEQVHKLDVLQGLYETDTLAHDSIESMWRQSGDTTVYTKRPSVPPQIALPLTSRGVNKLLQAGDYLITTVNSMPTTAFVWKSSVCEAIVTNTRIRDVLIPSSAIPIAVIISEDSVTIWNESNPISIPAHSESPIRGAQIIRATQSTLSLMLWHADKTFFTMQTKLTQQSQFDNMDTSEISLLRRGSPMLTDDLSRVVELAAAVQQNEWGHTTGLQVEDTFQNRRERLIR